MISTKRLAEFCRRAATSLHAGLDVRQVFEREALIARGAQQSHMTDIMQRIGQGATVTESMQAQHYFPTLAVEMINVGEKTGKLERVFRQLSEHYENLLQLRRTFIAGLTWPAIQLFGAIAIVGLLILILGLIGNMNGGHMVDVLGLGLMGVSGLMIYLSIVAVVLGALGLIVFAISRGWGWTGGLMYLLIRVPMLGKCLQYLALSRIAWALGMGIDAGMSAIESLELALRASQNIYYQSAWPAVSEFMEKRMPMADALRASGRFSEEFVLVLETGELTGRVPEALDHHAHELEDRAKALLRMLTVIAGTIISFAIMGLIAAVILRLGMFYVGMINKAASGDFDF
jgi:type IV pilus assembly protein PilC